MSNAVQLTGRRLAAARVLRSLAVILLVLSTLGWLVGVISVHTLVITLISTCMWIWITPGRKVSAH